MSRLKAEIHPFLTEDVVAALNQKQIHTVLDFIKAETQQIVKTARLNFREVLTVRNFLLTTFSAVPTNGFDCYKRALGNAAIIATGIKGVDRLLNGGLYTGNIYEICGSPGAGKTHFVLTLLKNVISNTNQCVYLFDTKNDFSGLRMKTMLNGMKQQQQLKCLDRIMVKKAYTRYDLINSLYDVKNTSNSILKLRLIIIDSLPGVLLDSNDNSKNNAFLNHLVNIMKYLATEHHIVFLITNVITTWNEDVQQDSIENIACGRYWFSVPNTRLKIEKAENNLSCKITVLSSDDILAKKDSCINVQFVNEGFL